MSAFLVIANWKQNGSRETNKELLASLLSEGPWPGIKVVVCPPLVYIEQVAAILTGSFMELGTQQISAFSGGAYTGEVSAAMLAEFGCEWALVGHSERRLHCGEDETGIAKKLQAAQARGMNAALCVGETLEQRDSGKDKEVVDSQLQALRGLRGGAGASANEIVIAYEPVWAIGTGRLPASKDIANMHSFIKERIRSLWGLGSKGEAGRVLYGGSVNAETASWLASLDDVDGVLVGGASLRFESFSGICRSASSA